MKPAGKYIIVSTSKEQAKAGGLLNYSEVATSNMRGQRGLVIEVGNEVEQIHKGDNVYYDKARAFDMPIDGEVYTMIREMDVFVIIPLSDASDL